MLSLLGGFPAVHRMPSQRAEVRQGRRGNGPFVNPPQAWRSGRQAAIARSFSDSRQAAPSGSSVGEHFLGWPRCEQCCARWFTTPCAMKPPPRPDFGMAHRVWSKIGLSRHRHRAPIQRPMKAVS